MSPPGQPTSAPALSRPAPTPWVRARPRIFVSVAAYCDPMLGFTLRSALAQARHPDRVFIGVVEQNWPQEQLQLQADWARRQLRWTRVHALQARGPCWARALAMALYQGEDWFFQVDAHTWFEPGWDERLIEASARCGGGRHVISCYPNPFHVECGEPRAEVIGAQVLAHAVKPGCEFDRGHPVLLFEGVPVASRAPVPAIHVAAGALWAPGCFVDELPYDPRLYFHGEEQAVALRAWTRGWDLWHVPAMPVYHLYQRSDAPQRPVHWLPEHDRQRVARAAALTDAANRRLRALLWEHADLGAYGLGDRRSLADYAAYSGIDYAARRIGPPARGADHAGRRAKWSDRTMPRTTPT